MVYNLSKVCYFPIGRGCRLVAVPAFKAVWGAIALSPVGSIPTPSAKLSRPGNIAVSRGGIE